MAAYVYVDAIVTSTMQDALLGEVTTIAPSSDVTGYIEYHVAEGLCFIYSDVVLAGLILAGQDILPGGSSCQ